MAERRRDNADTPLLDLRVWIRRPLEAPEGWHTEVAWTGQRPEELAAAIDKAFADLREKVKEVLR